MQRWRHYSFPPEATILIHLSVAKVISEEINSINLFSNNLVPLLLHLSDSTDVF